MDYAEVMNTNKEISCGGYCKLAGWFATGITQFPATDTLTEYEYMN